jgi:hypothetical protein
MHSGPILAFLLLELGAGVVFVWRRGPDTVATVVLIWLGMLVLAGLAWWAGRHRLAHPTPDPVPAARARAALALLAVSGMLVWSAAANAVGLVMVACGLGGWLWAAWRSGGLTGLRERLTRSPRPFVPLLLFIALPRLMVGGPAYLAGATLALPSGIGQQLFYLVGLYGPLEAIGRRSVAAVVSALIFGLLHVPFVLEANHGDVLAAFANTVLFQASVGIVACLAYQRHRAVLPIGAAHALAIG